MSALASEVIDVIDSANVLWAKADVAIAVAGPPSIAFTIAGPWDPEKQPANGTYSFSNSAGGGREPPPGGGGLDALFFGYDFDNSENRISVLLTMLIPGGSVISPGQSFTKFLDRSQGTAGQFQLTLSNNLARPDDFAAVQAAPLGTGTLRLDSVSQFTDGSWAAHYSFAVVNPVGGTIIGTGAARWN